jgi:hypothetical protein
MQTARNLRTIETRPSFAAARRIAVGRLVIVGTYEH